MEILNLENQRESNLPRRHDWGYSTENEVADQGSTSYWAEYNYFPLPVKKLKA